MIMIWIRTISCILLLFCVPSVLYAQDDANPLVISGKVLDDKNQPVPYATAAAYDADSTLVAGAVSGEDGTFNISIDQGEYIVKITFIGYEEKIIPDVVITNSNVDVGSVTLAPAVDVLQEVMIIGEKDQMELQLDKRVFNVGQDLSNLGANAADILGNLPSVSVDPDGTVSLRGSENVTIWINGRPSSLTSRDPDALRKLQGGMIEKVEVITNPSSRYDAAGEVGIINIILKKEHRTGFNGTFMANGGYPRLYGGSYSINYRSLKLNMFSSYGVDYRKSPGYGKSEQRYSSADTTFTYFQENDRVRSELSHNFVLGLDYFMNDRNSITGSFTYNPSNGVNTATTNYFDYDANEVLTNITTRTEREEEDEENIELAINYKKDFQNKDRKFTMDFQWIKSVDDEKTDYTQAVNGDSPLLQRGVNNAKEETLLFQSDYIHPLGADTKVEAGVKATRRIIRNDFSLEQQDDEMNWIPFDAFTNNMEYTENISAAYAMLNTKINKISLQAGLRGELSDITTELLATGQINDQNYFNLFPTAAFSYEFDKSNTLQLSYSRRISRPDFRNLLPFSDFRDPRVYFVGNPNLRPEYTDSYEVGHLGIWKNISLLSSVYYRHRTDVIRRITDPPNEEGVALVVPINMASENAVGVEFNFSLSVMNWWKLNTNANFFRAITEGFYEDERLYSDTYTWTTRTTSKMTFFKNLDFQISYNYRGPRITPQGKDLSIYSIDLGLSRDVFNGKGTITAGVRDLMNSRKRRSVIDTQGYYSNSEFQWRPRQFTISFTYRLNREKEKQNNRNRSSDDGPEDEF
jgi:outer membrane receptor protein involved in Fe transport